MCVWVKEGGHLSIDRQGSLNQLLQKQGQPHLLQLLGGHAEALTCRGMYTQGHLQGVQCSGQCLQKPAYDTQAVCECASVYPLQRGWIHVPQSDGRLVCIVAWVLVLTTTKACRACSIRQGPKGMVS